MYMSHYLPYNITKQAKKALMQEMSDFDKSNYMNMVSEYIRENNTLHTSDSDITLFLMTCDESNKDAALITAILSDKYNVYFSQSKAEVIADNEKTILHRHSSYELMYVLEGEVYQNIENERHYYSEGSGCLMNLNTRHMEEYSGCYKIIFLQLSPEYIEKLRNATYLFEEKNPFLNNFFDDHRHENNITKEYIDFIPTQNLSWLKSNMNKFFDKLFNEFVNPSISATYMINAYLCNIFYNLFSKEYYIDTPIRIGSEPERLLFEQITAFMIASHSKVTRKMLTDKFSYSGDYLYKIISKYTGMSIYNYSVELCMREAERLLRTTDLNINEIAESVGFHNYTQFYKQFQKRFNLTPRKYRLHRWPTGPRE